MDRTTVGAIHFDQIEQHGGQPGVRDEGLIQSALARPRNKWAYQPQCDLATLAAAYGFGLTKNHGFVDGNKRVGLMAMLAFLGLNSLRLDAPEAELFELVAGVAAGKVSKAEAAIFVQRHVHRRERQ